jgi:predicted nucleic acid-binding protein
MIIVDTSVLIDFFCERQNDKLEIFDRILNSRTPFSITEQIYQELLQGAASERDYRELKRYLDTVPICSITKGRESYAEAAHLFLYCRSNGVTVRNSIDCLIAQITMEHSCHLLHNDRDFDQIAKVLPALKCL